MPIRFHWRLLQGGERGGTTRASQHARPETALPDLAAQEEFCRSAEGCGIESLLTDFNFGKPDPILLSAALAFRCERLKLMIAIRSGVLSPTLFVQQINTLSALANGRLSLNVVAGHSPTEQRGYGDFLPHDERYRRTAEFLDVCSAFWTGPGEVNYSGNYYRLEGGKLNTPFVSPDGRSPEIFISGSSNASQDLAIRHGACWMRVAAEDPWKLGPILDPVLAAGKQAGLRMCIISKPTRTEALRSAYALLASADERERRTEAEFVQASDSCAIRSAFDAAGSEWLTPWLWTGAVRTHGAPAISLVGTPEEVCEGILEFRRAGVSHFIFSGWPKRDAMEHFGNEILPLVRKHERGASANA